MAVGLSGQGNAFNRKKNKPHCFLSPRSHLSASCVFQNNKGHVHEINPSLLPELIAGVKDFHQIALWFYKQESPGGQDSLSFTHIVGWERNSFPCFYGKKKN